MTGGAIILPPDPFWPIRIRVQRAGEFVGFNHLMLYHWQFNLPRSTDAVYSPDAQADGAP